jgi:hypothetical protein
VYLVVMTAYEACQCVSIPSVYSFIANIVGNVHIVTITCYTKRLKDAIGLVSAIGRNLG